jgi:Fur family ferric uptake transcriptional regulator/Fur family peroxide stress response transcriptional regulator
MNKRNTIQRSLVLEAVKELRRHATADEVYNTVAKKYPDIGRGTVYRNLRLLSDTGEIRKVAMPGRADRYDHLCHEHYHARCINCGQVFDVEMEFIANLERSITDTHGFEFTGHDIIFKGYCPQCKNARIREHVNTP